MASHRVVISETAQADIENIYLFLIENGASGETALNYVLQLEERCQKLGTMPMGGRPRDDVRPGLRIFTYGRRDTIAYVLRDDTLFVTNIFHAGQDVETLLRDN
jgi:toxin ParE1/3/4